MTKHSSQRIIIVGATSGIGREVALLLLKEGHQLGLAGRREEQLKELQKLAPDHICIRSIDIRREEAANQLDELIGELGGMDLYLHCSGIGHQNYGLSPDIELDTLETNGTGFTRMVTAAFRYFARQGNGHIAVISSIAGTKGLGAAPAYSATKRFQNTYWMHWNNCLHAASFHPLHRYPSRLCRYRIAQRRKTLSHADEYGLCCTENCLSLASSPPYRRHRLAIPDHGLFLETDSSFRLEAFTGQKLTLPEDKTKT